MANRVFLLSPARTAGKRAAMLFNPLATFPLAERVRLPAGAPVGEVFSFLSGLYFRGKLTYASQFAQPGSKIHVITSDRGLITADITVTIDDLRAMASGSIDHDHEPYRVALERDALALRASLPAESEVVLLGSIATDKYVAVLARIFGERLLFPVDFIGRGDMSRGGLLLRCAREGRELDYTAIMTATRRGSRAPKLAAVRGKPRATATAIPHTFAPMEAKPVTEIPAGDEWQYEPKWDGFRCLAFREDDDVTLMSKAGKPLTRYFPEIVRAIRAMQDSRFVLDGELVVPAGDELSFDGLLQRIHPAESRIRKLAAETPATYLVFDYLMSPSGERLADAPLELRRKALEKFASRFDGDTIRLSPATRDLKIVQRWFKTVGSGLDGIIAKRLDLPYQSGARTGMQKLKHRWTADCVVGGFRYATNSRQVGSLLLGLYNAEGKLDHVGFLSAIRREERAALTKRLEKLVKPPGFTGNAPGGPSRWSTARSAAWQPVAPKLVVEVQYDHFTGGRFRHATRFVRWRPDKAPRSCTVEQLPARNRSALTLLDR